jgi:hypothetical protein
VYAPERNPAERVLCALQPVIEGEPDASLWTMSGLGGASFTPFVRVRFSRAGYRAKSPTD